MDNCLNSDHLIGIRAKTAAEEVKTESSDLYCLAEFKDAEGVKVRNDRSFEKDYIQGKYGAIPYLNYDLED